MPAAALLKAEYEAWFNPPVLHPTNGGPMSRILLGTICGLVYGALSAASMIPLSFTDKTAALTGAFLNRFAIGFVIGAARLPLPSWAQGLIFGILLSLPDAIITKTYAPILILGAVGGVIIGLIVGKWGV
jgi:hypothetical protein